MQYEKRIRVMFVVPDLRIGGAERHVTTLAPTMDKTRFENSVICIGQRGDLFATLVNTDVKSTALDLAGKKNAARALWRLVSIMRNERPDVVIVRGYNAEVLGRIAAILAGVPRRVVWVHEFDFGHAQRHRARNILDRMLGIWTTSYFGVAEAQRDYIVEQLHCPAGKVRIIHNGVDLARFDDRNDNRILTQLGIEPDRPVVGTIAALRVEKDHRTLLHAARLVLDDLPATHFIIVGDGPVRAELEVLASGLGISDNVHFTGARSDIPQLLQAIDVFALTSVKETFPIAVLEAMACGRPVVSTDVGGVREAVEDGLTGYLVPAQNPVQFATRLKELLSDSEAAESMGRVGRRRMERDYSLQQSVEATERAIELLMK